MNETSQKLRTLNQVAAPQWIIARTQLRLHNVEVQAGHSRNNQRSIQASWMRLPPHAGRCTPDILTPRRHPHLASTECQRLRPNSSANRTINGKTAAASNRAMLHYALLLLGHRSRCRWFWVHRSPFNPLVSRCCFTADCRLQRNCRRLHHLHAAPQSHQCSVHRLCLPATLAMPQPGCLRSRVTCRCTVCSAVLGPSAYPWATAQPR